jgi:hypothetical protein
MSMMPKPPARQARQRADDGESAKTVNFALAEAEGTAQQTRGRTRKPPVNGFLEPSAPSERRATALNKPTHLT